MWPDNGNKGRGTDSEEIGTKYLQGREIVKIATLLKKIVFEQFTG
jgi:hypothetical protein